MCATIVSGTRVLQPLATKRKRSEDRQYYSSEIEDGEIYLWVTWRDEKLESVAFLHHLHRLGPSLDHL